MLLTCEYIDKAFWERLLLLRFRFHYLASLGDSVTGYWPSYKEFTPKRAHS